MIDEELKQEVIRGCRIAEAGRVQDPSSCTAAARKSVAGWTRQAMDTEFVKRTACDG